LLITAADWRAIFFINIPVVLLAILLGWRFFPRDSRRGDWREFDYWGAVLLPASLVSVAVFFLLLARGGRRVFHGSPPGNTGLRASPVVKKTLAA
jgi:predicted MFS family arabinose efflux permease